MARLRILVTGGTGFLAPFVVRVAQALGHTVVTTSRSVGDVAIDLQGAGMVDAVLEAMAPDVVLHLAAMARLADCEQDERAATRINAEVPARFAERIGARCVFVSTDLVFDGRAAPYAATAPVSPLSVYGASKAYGEEQVRAHGGRVVRLPLLFGPDASGRGATASLRAQLQRGQRPSLFTNEYRSPMHAFDAAQALVALVERPDGPVLLHVAGPERVSRWELGQRFARVAGLDASALQAAECQDPLRPRDVALVPCLPPSRSLDAMLADG